MNKLVAFAGFLPFIHFAGLFLTMKLGVTEKLGIDRFLTWLGQLDRDYRFDLNRDRWAGGPTWFGELISCRYCSGFWGGVFWGAYLFWFESSTGFSDIVVFQMASYFLYYFVLKFVDQDLDEE